MKYQYSPGLIGYGVKGNDGSVGLQGMSLYFSDYDVIFNKANIENAIENNYVMWASGPPNIPLPNGKTYVTKDLFIVPNGDIYEIDASENTFTLTEGKLSKTDFFTFISTLTDGFQRWENTNNTNEGYLIDSVKSYNTVPDYTAKKTMYGIPLKEFARIEMSDVSIKGKTPFTLYSIAENNYVDDHKAFGLMFDHDEETFRIGNIDYITEKTRDTNLTFDALTVQYNRPQIFDNSTGIGTVLTNKEINTPLLFDSTFVANPPSFTYTTPTPNVVKISWKLQDFVPNYNASNISGDLHFYRDGSTQKTYNIMDSSTAGVMPMIFHNVPIDGSVWIMGFDWPSTSPKWSAHMIIKHNGWERQSDVLSVQP